MPDLDSSIKSILSGPKETWLVTGVAGFIGSHIAEMLLRCGQTVHGLDNFKTGKHSNVNYLTSIAKEVSGTFTFFEADICDKHASAPAFEKVRHVLHQAALGSVPRSIDAPFDSHQANVSGFLNILDLARETDIKRIVYASSSSVYGDSAELPKVESNLGKVLSPYAATKRCDEIYADAYSTCYGMELVGLRYFNVFGARQDPDGPYAAVIPKWIDSIQKGDSCKINGDGETSRDFCYIDNVVFANIASAKSKNLSCQSLALNVACGESTTLNELYEMIAQNVKNLGLINEIKKPEYLGFRPGDVRHSLADISRAQSEIGYKAFIDVREGMSRTVRAYFEAA